MTEPLEVCPKCGHLKYRNRDCQACVVYSKRRPT